MSHDPAAAEIADRLVYVEDGRVVEEAQRSGSRTLVVANGWLRLPDALLSEIGAPRRLVASRRGRELVVIAADQNRPAAGVRPASGTRSTSARAVTARLDDVTKRYGERIVLDRLTARFAAGAFTVVTGPSGSGKTTLLHLLAGLERPTAGEIEVAATKLGPLSRDSLAEHRRRTVALVTQEPGLVPFLTAIENVRLGLQIRRQSVTGAADALAAVGLGSRPELPVARLSAGERQRVALARALAAEVPLLLVDEPSARLDRENAVLSASLLVEAAHRYGRAVVCATHDPVLIERADEVLELGAGARRARTSGPATRA